MKASPPFAAVDALKEVRRKLGIARKELTRHPADPTEWVPWIEDAEDELRKLHKEAFWRKGKRKRLRVARTPRRLTENSGSGVG